MDWQEHMREAVYGWLLGAEPEGCLGEDLLLLLGNPDLFDEPRVAAEFGDVRRVGVFRRAGPGGQDVAFTTPKFGAPVVAMYLEVAAMAGVRRVIALGYVGALRAEIAIGELFLPTRAISLDGTTRAYFGEHVEAEPSRELRSALAQAAREAGASVAQGPVVSIDALMLETSALVQQWHDAGHAAVDLETACVFALGERLGLECAALHIVSDNPFRRRLDPEAGHMATLEEQLRIALGALHRSR